MGTSSEHQQRLSGRRKTAGKTIYVVPTNAKYAKFCRGSLAKLGKRSTSSVSVLAFDDWIKRRRPARPARSVVQTFFVSSLADISQEAAQEAKSAKGAKFLVFAAGMPVEALASRLSWLDIRNEERLHVAHEESTDQIFKVIYRLLSGISQSDGPKRIVDAWIEGENLVLLSPSFERLTVPRGLLEKYIGKDESKIRRFAIDEDGAFLHWLHKDVHFGWEQFLHLVNPASALAAKERSAEFNRHYGAAIRELRVGRGLSQSQISGLTERHLRRIEQGEQAVTRTAIESLAEAQGLDVRDYMSELAKRLK